MPSLSPPNHYRNVARRGDIHAARVKGAPCCGWLECQRATSKLPAATVGCFRNCAHPRVCTFVDALSAVNNPNARSEQEQNL